MPGPEPAVAREPRLGREPALELRGVTAGYGREPAVREVDLAVRGGEIVGLVGPNGSGKTTLVRVASRALRPWAGEVRLGGRNPYAVSAREAATMVAVVPQDLAPAFAFTALEVVLMGRAPYRTRWGGRPEDFPAVRAAMAGTEVQHLADRAIDELSGGERRRVVLAQALAQGAPVLLLDEPTTHLDLRHVLDVLAIVRRLADRERVAVLAIHHDLTLAAATCDRLVVLHRGAISAEGPPGEIVTSRLLREVYGVEAEVSTDPVTGRPSVHLDVPTEPATAPGRRAHVVGGAGRGAPIFRMLSAAGYDVSVGVLHGSDTDAEVAERLNLVRVSVPPFSEIDADAEEACRRLMLEAELLVVCDAPFGRGNFANLRLALDAARTGVPTVLLEQLPIEERDFTAGSASELWSELRAVARVARSYDELGVLLG